MYLANALIVLAIMALVIPAVLFAAYIIGAATLPPIFNAVNNATPTPAKFQRQKEVFDAWQYIMTHQSARPLYLGRPGKIQSHTERSHVAHDCRGLQRYGYPDELRLRFHAHRRRP